VQGFSQAERALQRATAYAEERAQGRGPNGKSGEMSPIIEHADIRRTLMTMRTKTQAARMICLATALELDVAHRGASKDERELAAARGALLTPVAKAFSTDIGCEVTSLGLQVHGGMGYMEETGASQNFRDARILPIYEGTNGIQAIDLVTRKLPLADGKVVAAYITEMRETIDEVSASNHPQFGSMAERLGEVVDALAEATQFLGEKLQTDPEAALAGATPYLRLFGLAAGGVYLARGALADVRSGAGEQGPSRHVVTARFFAEQVCVEGTGLAKSIVAGSDVFRDVTPDLLSA